MNRIAAYCGLIISSLASAAHSAIPIKTADAVHVVRTFRGPDGFWDYPSIDDAEHLLLVGRIDGVTSVDLTTGKLTPRLIAGNVVHSVVPLANGRAMAMSGNDHKAIIFNVHSGKIYAKIDTGGHPDAAVLEPTTQMVLVSNKESGEVAIIDPVRARLLASIPVGGDLEFIAADGRGRVYVNISNTNKIAVIDVGSKMVVGHLALPRCAEPSGLAIDPQSGTLVSACSNGIAVLMKIDGSGARTVAIGAGPDGVTFDPRARRFLIPCGKDGVIAVVAEDADGKKGVRLLRGIRGARTGALDAASGLFYVPTAVSLPAVGGTRPGHVPGTFKIVGLRIPSGEQY